MKRRRFLQFAGSTLATIGLSQLDFFQQANQYGRVLAQSTPRKLALLVGINSYDAAGTLSLGGCLNDVELQRQLLIHRFGFHPSDIVEVSDNSSIKPTRANILQTFEEHLIQQAKPGDVVVFHYSGHGDLVEDPYPIETEACLQLGDCNLNGTMVPNDAASTLSGSDGVVPDIMGRTLFLLMSAIETNSVTAILDSCHSGAGTRGSAVVRAAARMRSGEVLVPSSEELEYQARWMSALGWDEDELNRRRTAGIAKGVAIGSALRDQLAVDAQFDGFKAGGFTYLLTRYLWQQPATETNATVYSDMQRSTRSLSLRQRGVEQVPVFEYAPESDYAQQPMYFTPLAGSAAEAVIISTSNAEQIQFWLGGVSSQNLKGDGIGTIFTGIDDKANIKIEQISRVEGLYGIGKLIAGSLTAVQPGMLLREEVVGISPNPVLTVGLDDSLGDERSQAETDLRSQSRVEIVPVEQLTDTGYIFGRMTERYHQALSADGVADLPFISSIGLFTADQRPVSNSFGRIDEPVTAAVNRLSPTFKSLLAKQVLGQLTAGESSQLQVRAQVVNVDSPSQGVEVATRGARDAGSARSVEIPQFASGTTLAIEVENLENEALYLSVLIIGADGSVNVLYPADWSAPEEAARIDAQSTITVPRPQDKTVLQVQGSSGFPEILMLVSTQPLRNALRGMQTIASDRRQALGPLDLREDEPVTVLDALLGDLDDIARSTDSGTVVALSTADPSVVRLYDTNKLAVLSAVIQVGG